MKKRLLALLLVTAIGAMALLGACSGNTGNTETLGTSAASPSGTEAQNTANTDGALKIALVTDVISLDPHVKDSGTEMQLSAHLYDTLVEYNPDMSIKPGVAESWEVADDGITWTFHIREGIKFQNGNDLTASDVVYSIERIMNDEQLEMIVYLGRIAEIKAIDEYTVQMVAKYQYPLFANSFKHIAILDKETCEGLSTEEISSKPNGSGRYKLVEHVKESQIVLVRNEEYWGEKPAIKDVTFRVISNSATRTAALLNGEVDFISKIPVMDVSRVESSNNLQVVTFPSASCNYMGFDHLNATNSAGTDSPNPLKNIKVRQAMMHAIDIEAIIKTVMNGYATPANSYMPAGYVGFDETAPRRAYDAELAKQLLAEAGYPDGFNLRIDSRNDGSVNNDQVAQAIASYLEKVGIKTEVNLMPRATFMETTAAKNLQSSFFMAGWGDSSGEGITILSDMIYTYEGKEGLGEGNKGHYSNPEVDKILDQAMIELDQNKRAELVKQADAIAREEVACIPLFFADEIFGLRSGIEYTPRVDGHILAWDFVIQ